MLSTIIESLQLLTSVNFFDVDDILLNALGFVIGGMAYAVVVFMFKRFKKWDDLTRLEIEENGRLMPTFLKSTVALAAVFLACALGVFLKETIS